MEEKKSLLNKELKEEISRFARDDSTTSPRTQGRVFSARRVISESISVIPMATSGPIVDKILTPIFEKPGKISSIFGQGKGGAISIMSFVAGIMIILVSIVAFLYPQIMNVEDVELEKVEGGEETTNI